MFTLQEIHDQHTWDELIRSQPWNQFLQSWAWGEFQKRCGRDVRRFALREEEEVTCAAQFIRFQRYGFSYWFAPRGPVLFDRRTERGPVLIQSLIQQLSQQKLPGRNLFYRVEPFFDATAASMIPSSFHRRRALNPSATVLVDLAQTEEELLAAMHTKTRYNIRLAERHGVAVRVGSTAQDYDAFFRLLQDTSLRDAFIAQPEPYLRKMIEELGPNGFLRVRLAEHQGKPMAANIEIAFGDTVTYLHGASSSEARNIMAPYALQWGAIQAAKHEGFKLYDFWGCNPDEATSIDYKPSWEGITRFKAGFNGEKKTLVGTWDAPLSPFLYKMLPIGR
jgi:peptidoglycan pentaglycine glycine transferase (the first glycine)